jgi:hypothetical protein
MKPLSMTTETYVGRLTYKIYTEFNDAFPCITIHIDLFKPKLNSSVIPLNIEWPSGGLSKQPTIMKEWVELSSQYAKAWKLAQQIVKHHLKTKEIFKLK